MTTFQIPAGEDQALADALAQVAILLERRADFASRYVREMSNAAAPSNGFHLAHVPYAERNKIAAAAREVADGGHPLADRLHDLAAGLEESVRAAAVNGVR